ncbi:MAG: response regulator transcription factor [Anaerolineae bacterium]|nr:response regulator transcription factor [Anaerolineae bacterium]
MACTASSKPTIAVKRLTWSSASPHRRTVTWAWSKRLYLSEGTVRNYVSAILSKLEVSDRTQAAVLALRHGLVDIGDEP